MLVLMRLLQIDCDVVIVCVMSVAVAVMICDAVTNAGVICVTVTRW